MHIMTRFTITHLKRNKRQAFFSCFAIFIATLFISTLIFFAYSYNQNEINLWVQNNGEWHGAIAVGVSSKQIGYIQENPEVEKTFVKTNFYAQRPQNIEGRPYLAHIDLDKHYRNDMGWTEMAIEGRLPEREDEIAVSEDFFIDNPSYGVGSQLVVDEGSRQVNGEMIDVRDPLADDEAFSVTKASKVYTIVGKLDAAYEYSNIPSYMSIGYSDKLLDDKTYIINVKFKNVKKTYELMPQLAANVGLTTDSEGEYPVRYNTYLLDSYGVFQEGMSDQFRSLMIVYIVAGLAIISFFVTIIYHTFAVSAKSRVKYLGLLKSIGATPRQIRDSVLIEGLLLSSISMPLGLLGGYGITTLIFGFLNDTYKVLEMEVQVAVYVSLTSIIGIVLMTLCIVLISAYFPARKVARLAPIVAIKQGDYKVARFKENIFSHWIEKILGYEGTLALKSNRAHRKSFRAAYISLTLSFVIFMGGITYLNVWQLSINYDPRPIGYAMKLYLSDVSQEELERLDQEVRAISQVEAVQRNKGPIYGYTQVAPTSLSNEVRERGVEYLEKEVALVDESYNFNVNITTLDDTSFNNYCNQIGAKVTDFYNTHAPRAILYNSVTYNYKAIREEQEDIPLFNWEIGTTLEMQEDLGRDDKTGTPYAFNIEIGYVTDQVMAHGKYYDDYDVTLIIPESMAQKLVTHFSQSNQQRFNRDTSYLEIKEENIPLVKMQIEEIYKTHKDKANFRIWDLISSREGQQKTTELTMYIAGLGIFFITLVGVVNIYSTLSNQVNMRRKEFAMLKSIGISPRGIDKILMLESAFYSIKPIIYSVPILIIFAMLLLRMARFKWVNIFSIFPYGIFLIGAVILTGIIFSLSYIISRKILRETIMDVLKDESF